MSDTMIDNEVVKAKINGLYAAYRSLEQDSKPKSTDYQTILPWRIYNEDSTTTNRVTAVKQAMDEIADEIIFLENCLRDPMQDAEIRAEINASIAMNGNWDDCADDYMNTPMQERLYQENIQRMVQYDYDSEHGFYDPCGPCSCCGTFADYDECVYVAGYSTCYNGCYEEARVFMYILSMITGVAVDDGPCHINFKESEIV